jgi:hypothetical protein
VHAALARRVGRGRDHAALGRVTVPADHDGPSGQFWPAQYLHCCDELIEVDV